MIKFELDTIDESYPGADYSTMRKSLDQLGVTHLVREIGSRTEIVLIAPDEETAFAAVDGPESECRETNRFYVYGDDEP